MAGQVDWLIFHGFCYFKNPLLACYQSAVCETAFSGDFNNAPASNSSNCFPRLVFLSEAC